MQILQLPQRGSVLERSGIASPSFPTGAPHVEWRLTDRDQDAGGFTWLKPAVKSVETLQERPKVNGEKRELEGWDNR